ncbi:MAG: EthD domain-containing protein [Janthinobacterium lividum]
MSEPPALSAPDFSVRDAAIRLLSYTPLKRRDGVPPDLFAAYWRDVHGPLCARLPGLGFYAQHHFDRERSANLWPRAEGVEPLAAVLDGAVEIGFARQADQALFQAASPLLFSDERNFIGHDVAYELPQGSRTLVDREPDPVPNRAEPGHRLHLHLHGRPDASGAWVGRFATELAATPGILKVRLHLPEPYHNSEPEPAAPGVDHRLPQARKSVAILELCWPHRLAAEAFLSGPRYAALAGDMAAHVSALGCFLVSGVYTFIRDGALTTAGLRGSRPAALIERLGALNQTTEEVTRLFHPR